MRKHPPDMPNAMGRADLADAATSVKLNRRASGTKTSFAVDFLDPELDRIRFVKVGHGDIGVGQLGKFEALRDVFDENRRFLGRVAARP